MAETKETNLNLYQKLAKITGDVGAIKKDGTNRDQGYAFIEYAAVAGELRYLFAKYGVIIVPYMAKTDRQGRQHFKTPKGGTGTTVLIDFTFVVINADKPDERFSVSWTGEATDYGDKATNKAATSALKYYLMRQFNISEKGDDPDAETPTVPAQTSKRPARPAPTTAPGLATQVQKAQIRARLKGKGIVDEDMKGVLMGDYGVNTETLTSEDAERIIEELGDDI